MAVIVSILFAVFVYYILYKSLFGGRKEFIDELKSLLAWLPVTLLLDYDFSEATWRIFVWLASGLLFGALLLSLLT